MSKFIAYEVAIELVKALREPVGVVKTQDRNLADQMQRAATSVVLNIAEGRERAGKDRIQHYRIALGSTSEVGAALDVARAWRYLDEASAAAAVALVDRVRAILWRLINGGGPYGPPPRR